MLALHQKPDEPQKNSVLAAIVSLLTPDTGGDDFLSFENEASAAQLLAQLRWHRVGLRIQPDIPASFATRQRQQYNDHCQSALQKTAANIQSLTRIARCLDEHGIAYLSFKGPALAQLLYGSALLKQSVDIDILVRPQDTLAAIEALQSIGIISSSDIVPNNPQTWKTIQLLCKDWMLDDQTNGCHVELHWRVEINPFLLPTQFDLWFERKSCVSLGSSTIHTLCIEDLFIQVMVHGARSLWTRLHWLLDFDALLRRDDINWKQVSDTIGTDGLHQILLYSLRLSQRLLATPLPLALTKLIDSATHGQRRRADSLTNQSLQAMQHRRHITWLPLRLCYLKLMQKKSFQLFELITLIGPHQPDVMRLPLPIYLFPLYFLLRPLFVVQRRLSSR